MSLLPLLMACSLVPAQDSLNADIAAHKAAKIEQKTSVNISADGTRKTVRGPSLFETASAMARKGNHQAAIPIFRHLVDASDTLKHREALASSLLAVGQASEAASLLESEISVASSNNGAALYTLGKAWLAVGRYDEALAAFSEASNKLDGDPRPRSARGVTFAALGKINQSLNSFDMALKVRPGDRETVSNKALVMALVDQEDAAVSLLEGLVKDQKATARDRQNLALAYLMKGDRVRAEAMGRLDLDQESLNDTFQFYAEVKSLPVDYRMRALVAGAVDPAWTLRESGNLTLAESDAKDRAAERLITKPKPEPKPEPKPKPKPKMEIPPLLEPEGWAVQIGAYRTIKNLVRGWDILKARNEDILKDIPPRRSEKDFGPRDTKPSGFYYRLNAGPLKNFGEAKKLCKAFKARGTDCWIRPPEKAEGKLPSKKKKEDSQ